MKKDDFLKIKAIVNFITDVHKSLSNEIFQKEIIILTSLISAHIFDKKKLQPIEIKTKLFEIVDCLVNKYEKILGREPYQKIIEKINKEFCFFPTWEEFKFKQLMEKAFADKIKLNKFPYYLDKEININKEFKKY